MTDSAVCVTDLSAVVTGTRPYAVIEGIDFTLGSGDVLGLVGESGSGKTTLALALLGYARTGMQLRGSVRVGGIDMVTAPDALRRTVRGSVISYVQQDPAASLNPVLRIGTQLRERLRAHDRIGGEGGGARLADVLEKMQLPTSREFLRRYPHQLSGGQLQRVCIAMAVLCRPRVIVLDEPTTGLDVMTQKHVLELLREVVIGEDTAAVYVTHDLAVVEAVADRLAVMYAGMFVEEGPKDTVLRQPLHPYTRRLILSTPSLRSRRAPVGIGGSVLSPKDRSDSCSFAARCGYVIPQCRVGLPELTLTATDHLARCIRASEWTSTDAAKPASPRTESGWTAPSKDDAALLKVQSLLAWYAQNEVLHGIELSVAEGECLAVVGESGSGKTTLARCVSGLHTGRAEGVLRFDGDDVPLTGAGRSREVRREIQYIFQSPYGSLNPRQTVGRSIAMPLTVFGLAGADRRDAVRELLQRVALNPDYESRYPNQLSGGECQRVAIARALAAQPRVLVCDEITSALDVSIQASILDLLGKLRREMQLTLLFITHHLALVRTVADKIVIMRGGKIVEEGTAGELLDGPQDSYTRELIDSTPVFAAGELLGGRG